MTSGVAGLGIAVAGFAGRCLIRNKQLLAKVANAAPASKRSIFSKCYSDGFETKMTRREASLIHGVSPNAKSSRIKEIYKRTMSTNHPDRGGSPNIILNKRMLQKLEKVSGMRFKDQREIKALEEDIRIAEKVFEVNTEGVEPLYNIVEEVISCPLREDRPKHCSKEATLQNAALTMEDFFVTPKANIPIKPNPIFDKM